MIEPNDGIELSIYDAHSFMEPFGLEYLASYLESLGHECHVIQQRRETGINILERIHKYQPDILGISTLTYSINICLWFACEAKKLLPNVVVVLGGYHASAVPELVKNENVDFVVIGEGEIVFANLVSALSRGSDTKNIRGVATYDNKLIINAHQDRIDDLDSLPFPKRDKSILARCRLHGLMDPSPSQQRHVGIVAATRGCPYSCMFCCSNLMWKNEIKHRSPLKVADEIEVLVNKYDVNAAFFCDLTFNASKQYTIALCDEIAKRKLPVKFYAMCNLKGMDSEIVHAMAAAKVTKIGFGVESFIETTRTRVKDQRGMDLEETNLVLDEVSNAGILTKCYFIIGFPWETDEALSQLIKDISYLDTDEIKVSFYVPFPGTQGYDIHKSLMPSEDWAQCTTHSGPVVKNYHISPENFKKTRKEIYDKFYNGEKWAKRVKWRMEQFPQYSNSFSEFTDFLNKQGICKI